jgi:hypothetical protein
MRFTISNWSTTPADVDVSVAVIAEALPAVVNE